METTRRGFFGILAAACAGAILPGVRFATPDTAGCFGVPCSVTMAEVQRLLAESWAYSLQEGLQQESPIVGLFDETHYVGRTLTFHVDPRD